MEEIRYPFFVLFGRDRDVLINILTLDYINVDNKTFHKWKETGKNIDIERFISAPTPKLKALETPAVSELKIIVNQYCNLDCLYCYEKNKLPIKMNPKVVEKHLKENTYRSVSLFGGEPLLYFDTFKEIADTVLNAGIKRISTITNGTLITDEMAEFIADKGIDIAVSIDGRKEAHDKMRKDKNRNCTYDKVVAGIRKLQEHGINVTGSVTIADHNANTIGQEIEFLATELGIRNFSLSLYTGNVFSCGSNHDVLIRAYEALIRLGANEGSFSYLLETLISSNPQILGCKTGVVTRTLMPDGRFYGCHVFATFGLQVPSKEFKERTFDKIKECSRCYAAPICGGGCLFEAYVKNGDIYSPGGHCSIKRATMDWAVERFYR